MEQIFKKANEILNKAVADKKIKSFSLTNYEVKNWMKMKNPNIPDFLITSNLTINRNDWATSMQPFFLARWNTQKEVEQNYIKEIENEIKQYY